MKKQKIPSLTGLRGLAALFVCLSHFGFDVAKISAFPPLIFLAKTIGVGPNSVQIFFVLSGFLMSYLYPNVENVWYFLQRRYGRIFPLITVVMVFYGLVCLEILRISWYQEFLLLLFLALSINFLWRFFAKFKNGAFVGKWIFFGFLFLQLTLVILNLFILPKIIHTLPVFLYNTLVILENILLTWPLLNGLKGLAAAFWTLVPELLFYFLYPLAVVPLVKLAKKYGWLIGLVSMVLVIKILFNFDEAARGMLGMSFINVARMSGFVVGVAGGVIYQISKEGRQKISKFFAAPITNLLFLALFILVQVGDWALRDGQTIWFRNNYYLFSSIVFSGLVLTSAYPNTINERWLSSKFLVFLGTVSFSLYLMHSRVIIWSRSFSESLRTVINNPKIFSVFELAIYLGFNILTAYLLYRLIENLHFSGGKTFVKEKASTFKIDNKKRLLLYLFSGILITIWVYTGNFSPTLFITHHNSKSNSFLKSKINLAQEKIIIPFTAKYDNLAVVTAHLWYFKNASVTKENKKNPAEIYFRLYEEGKNKPLFETKRLALEVESEPTFPFGINIIQNSAGKKYLAEYEVKNGSKEDTVILNQASGLTVSYLKTKKEIISKPWELIWNRLIYTFNDLFSS